MHKKRLIGVITVLNGHAVQSIGYKSFLPLGKPKYQAENLDKWNIDEIYVNCIDRTRNNLGPDLELLKGISRMGISTPIIYSGGITTKEDASQAIRFGADRICIDHAIYKGKESLREISEAIGKQAIILNSPVIYKNNTLYHYDYIRNHEESFTKWSDLYLDSDLYSELMIIDVFNEGSKNSFNESLLHKISLNINSLILFGGITNYDQVNRLLKTDRVKAIAIGNSLAYTENSAQNIKSQSGNKMLRPPLYSSGLPFL